MAAVHINTDSLYAYDLHSWSRFCPGAVFMQPVRVSSYVQHN